MTIIAYDPTRPQFADVNHFHPVTDFDLYARSAGAGALAFKVTQGGEPDPTGAAHLAGAEQRGLVAIGFEYGVSDPDAFLSRFPPREGRIPVLDFEGSTASVKGAEAWIRAVKAAYGRSPWFYGNQVWLQAGAPAETEVQNCPYWGARYGGPLVLPTGVGQPVAFQFTDGNNGPLPHTFPGVSGACDVDMLIISPDELRALAGLGGAVATAPAPRPAPTPTPPFAGRDLRLQQPAMTGLDVKLWQQQMLALGVTAVGMADGSFGPATDAATRSFQASRRLPVDGVVGPSTWTAAWSAPTA
jgi:hypothetical protein